MKRLVCTTGVSLLLATSFTLQTTAAGPYDRKLPVDRQVTHVLQRLTFGPRPGDVQTVRRLGVEKWIDLQLRPDTIAENADLEERVKSLATVQMPVWQIFEKYMPGPLPLMNRPPSMVLSTLPSQQSARLLNCSVDERRTILEALDPELRRRVLTAVPPSALEGLPAEMVAEANSLRQAEQEERRKELRRLMPPLNEVLSPEQIRTANRGTRDEKLALFNSLDADKRRQVMRQLPMQAFTDVPELRKEAMAASQPQQFVNTELIEHKLYRAIYSNRQLEEVLVDFWMNHFNVYNGKGVDRVLLTSYERDAIRPNVFGRFHDLLLATARHPAMLFYLDNWQSQSPREDFPAPAGVRRPGLNENYGREIMELHTLGVDGGYTQDDVVAVARAFTGWTIFEPQRFAEFQFNPAFHDRKEKIVLGHTIPAMGAEQDGLQVIGILARHPSTAKFISKKLAQRFVSDDPPAALVSRMSATFTKSDGDLRAVLRTLLTSPEFVSEGAWQAKVKSPLELVVSAVRATNAGVSDTFALAQRIADLGQPLYGKVEPTGYPNTGEAWTNTASVLGRINFATALTADQIHGVKVESARYDVRDPAAAAGELLATAPSTATLAAIQKGMQAPEATPALLAALVIGSPDFQRR
jgi:uncharacterized protein (DUF1800 family)